MLRALAGGTISTSPCGILIAAITGLPVGVYFLLRISFQSVPFEIPTDNRALRLYIVAFILNKKSYFVNKIAFYLV